MKLVLIFLAEVALAWPSLFADIEENGVVPLDLANSDLPTVRSRSKFNLEDQVQTRIDLEHAAQANYHEKQISLGELPLGGGLLDGGLLPFTGALSALDIPAPQEVGLKEIPGDDVAHQFQYPQPSDVRGPCPALNSMANHGFISRSGITTFAEASNGCQLMFGVAYDNCVIVSAFTLLAGGDSPSGKFSIGGADSRVPNTRALHWEVVGTVFSRLIALLPAKTYTLLLGNQANFHLDRFNRLVNITKKYDGQFGTPAFAEERVLIYNEARKHNPEFTAQDIWLAVSNVERAFVFRGFINGTEPENAHYVTIAPFFLNDRIPNKWYRRGTPYNLANLGVDIASLLSASSELTVPGQNQGFNHFVPLGLDISHISPNTATCFLARAILDNTPGFAAPGVLSDFKALEAFINGAVKPFFAPYNCTAANDFADPGPNKGDPTPGVSTTSKVLINGIYQ